MKKSYTTKIHYENGIEKLFVGKWWVQSKGIGGAGRLPPIETYR